MEEILELLKMSCDSFYLGKDQKGWVYFTELIDKINYYKPTEEITNNEKKILDEFIFKFDEIMKFKKQKNITRIADILLKTHSQINILRS